MAVLLDCSKSSRQCSLSYLLTYFGRVKLVLHKPTNTPYALKCMRKGQIIALKQVEPISPVSPLYLPLSRPYLARISPISPPYLPISPHISPRWST